MDCGSFFSFFDLPHWPLLNSITTISLISPPFETVDGGSSITKGKVQEVTLSFIKDVLTDS